MSRHIKARLPGDLLKACGAGDVDLGEVLADDIEAHQKEPSSSQGGAQCGRNGLVAGGERLDVGPLLIWG